MGMSIDSLLRNGSLCAFIPVELTIASIGYENPWDASGHSGAVSLDEAPVYIPKAEDVARVVALGGAMTTSCVVELHPGDGRPRFVSWESQDSEPTGSGFHPDAYGGDAEIWCADSFSAAFLQISERERESMRFATHPSEEPLCEVLFDAFHQHRSFDELVAIARESGEFGEVAPYRINELMMRWKDGR